MTAQFERYRQMLENLTARNRRRSLEPRSGTDYSSNDYLALSTAPELREAARAALESGVAIGAGGSRLLRGNDPEHEALEGEAASFFGAERALYFGSGFAANTAIYAGLPQRGDLVVHDELVHASAHDGMRLGVAESVSFTHNDPQSAADRIGEWRDGGGTGRIWLAIESLYSMDGDVAPVDDFAEIAAANDAVMLIDEAHATGVFGPGGRGVAHAFEGRENVVTLHTCGKALGASGALVCGPGVVCDYLVNRSRPFIYATAPSPLMAAVVRAALRLLEAQPERREGLWNLIRHAGREAENFGISASGTQILPVIIGDDKRTMGIAAQMRARGFDIRGIRPPTVPRGTSRLRIALTLHSDAANVSEMFAALADIMEAARKWV